MKQEQAIMAFSALGVAVMIHLGSYRFGYYAAADQTQARTTAAAEDAYRQGFTEGLARGKLIAPPSPKACFSWWFGPEHTQDRIQQTKSYICKNSIK